MAQALRVRAEIQTPVFGIPTLRRLRRGRLFVWSPAFRKKVRVNAGQPSRLESSFGASPHYPQQDPIVSGGLEESISQRPYEVWRLTVGIMCKRSTRGDKHLSADCTRTQRARTTGRSRRRAAGWRRDGAVHRALSQG